ncbi:MAG: TRAP transporter large permease [Pyramidobacter sp.]|jgi:C4-dicarboxylate transporter DctM subunit
MAVTTLFVVLAIGLIIGLPIAVALGLSTASSILVQGRLPITLVAQRLFTSNDSFSLLAVPFFMATGIIMTRGGISKRLIAFANSLVGWISGGLAMVAALTSMFFAAISGSSSATVAAVGSALIPEMEKNGYDTEFSAAVCAAAGTTGIVIPPSVSMVLYCIAAGVSVGDAFMAAVIPGILMGLSIMVIIYFKAKKKGYIRTQRATIKEVFSTFCNSFWGLLTPVIIIGGIYGGVFTATEAAAVSVVYALLVSGFVYRELKIKDLPEIIMDSIKSTAVVMFIMNAAGLLSWIITMNHVPQKIATSFLLLSNNPYVLLLLINILLLVVGIFMNASPAVIILSPILVPIIESLGINKILFGVIMIVNLAIGTITPPVGVDLFVAESITGLSLTKIVKNVWPFMLGLLVVLFLVTYIPQIALFLPGLAK